MSIVLLVASHTQLTEGTPWLMAMSESTGEPPMALVLGTDHRTLARQVENRLEDEGLKIVAELIDPEVTAISNWLRRNNCHLLLMVDDVENDRFQASLFESCSIQCVWLKAESDPPNQPEHLFALDSTTSEITGKLSRRLLGLQPTLQLYDQPQSDEADSAAIAIELERLARQRCEHGDLLWITFGNSPSDNRFYEAARRLIASDVPASIALISRREGMDRSLLARVRYWASHLAEPMDREARLELAQSLEFGSQPNLEFLGLISAAAMLAAFGLLQNSAAVIIGAMLIAPLMTPILGAGLSLTHGNRPLFRTSLSTIALGFAGAFGSAFLFGLLVRFVQEPEVTPEMWSRCNPSPLDFCVGLVGGMAASYARTRSHLSSALAGAAIAAALVPPIATAGLQVAFGVFDGGDKGWPVFGPLVLVSVNVLTIMIGTSFVLYARGVRVEKTSVSSANKWATRMTVSLLTLVLLVLVWMLHLERWIYR